jgi:small subunit ribosomal protein S21
MAYFIEVRNNNVEKALRVLKKKLMKDGVMKEIKDRAHFIKPSMKKREARK